MKVADRLTDAGFGVGWSVIRRLPEPVVGRASQALADRSYGKRGRGVLQLRANLARVLPDATSGELDEATREGVRRYLRYWSEVFRMPAYTPRRLREQFLLGEGMERLDAAVERGGAIMVAPHSGNWDLAGAWACDRYGGIVTVAERLEPAGVYDKFVAYRERLGMEVLPHGDPETMRTLLRRLKSGALVCLVADRDLTGSGVHVDFFGETASMPAGPAMMSLLTGAPIMPVSLWYDGPVMRGRVDRPVEVDLPVEADRGERVASITQAMADAFARTIGEHPVDWHMMQRLWLSDLPEPVLAGGSP